MTNDDARKFDELDRLLNDPDVPLQPALIWHLLNEVSGQAASRQDRPSAGPGLSPST
jgi:hypothetical protein